MQIFLICMLVLGGCARGGTSSGEREDGGLAEPRPDAAAVDARPAPPPDAAAPIDAPPPPPPCIPITTQLLVNPELDQAPQGTGWVEQIIKAGYPVITPQDSTVGPPEHTPPYKAWLGGFAGDNVTDLLYQDVAIPPATTALVLTGFHDVRTDETGGNTYDTASATLVQPSGTLIATILVVSNRTPRTGWTPFAHTFAQNLSGQTVRLRFTSRNDGARSTSFYFDTLALTATHGCP